MSRVSQEIAQQILNEHNCVRSRYNNASLQWDWELAADAQVHADRCGFWHASEIGKLPSGQGENLSINTGKVGTQGWIAEERYYDCNQSKCRQPPCGHWTQMIWSDTERVGCAIQKCVNGTVTKDGNPAGWTGAELLVCRYSPPGNYVGQAPVAGNQCETGAKNSSCGDSGRFPKVSSSGRGVGVIVPDGVAATTGAGASRNNQSGLQVWSKKAVPMDPTAQAASLNVPISITKMTQTPLPGKTQGQLIFPWRTSVMIVSQYTPTDVKYFIDNYAPNQAAIDALTYKDIIKAMVEIEKKRKASGNIYVRSDQRKLLDSLEPQHLSPLLTLLQGLPTFYHTKLVDRFFQQIYAGDTATTKGNIANLATGKEQLSNDKDEQNIAKSIAGTSDDSRFDFSDVDEQEKSLTSRFAGAIDDDVRKENEIVAAKIASGTASEVETITNAYVLDATKAEESSFTIVEIILSILALIVLIFVAIVIYFMITNKNMAEEFQKLKNSVFGT